MTSPQPSPSDRPNSHSDAIDSPIIFFDGPVEMVWRPRQRHIPGMPADAFDLPPMPEKRKKKSEDEPKNDV